MVKKTSKPSAKSSVKTAASKGRKQKTTAPATTTASTTAPVVESLSTAFVDLLGQLSSLRSQLTTITSQVRALQKRTDRELKLAQKQSRKRARKSGNRAPSGFVKPTLISEELAAFLKKDVGTEMARTAVTREINSYIRTHSLQDPKNGRRILPDTRLRKLLKVGKSDELTYFNLQRYMSPHFAKAGNPPAADTV